MDVLLRPRTIEYRALGGTLDFYFFVGESPINAIQAYSQCPSLLLVFLIDTKSPILGRFIGHPQMHALWTLGFHLYATFTWTPMKRC